MKKLIVFATFWNEKDWVDVSLAQIEKLKPDEVIICDGCFDPNLPLNSTDGTKQIIEAWCMNKDYARLISPQNMSKFKHALFWLKKLKHEKTNAILMKIRMLPGMMRLNVYRLNQMTTFNYMISQSSLFKEGNWISTIDADQFFSDSFFDLIRTIRENDNDYELLPCKELTFFNNFDQYTEAYEKRDYNNMPHRISNDTRFIPTRHLVRIIGGKYKLYSDFAKKATITEVYHYRIRDNERLLQTYQVGDRKAPEEERMKTKFFQGNHPRLIQKYIGLLQKRLNAK